MTRLVSFAILTTVSCLLTTTRARACIDILQNFDTGALNVGVAFRPWGQSFTATEVRIVSVGFFLNTFGGPRDLTLAMFAGEGVAGALVKRFTVTIPPTTGAWVDFDFSDVTLVPGAFYSVVIENVAGNQNVFASDNSVSSGFPDLYVGGRMITSGQPVNPATSHSDARFRIVQCEPPIASIADVGNDQGRLVRIVFLGSPRDVSGTATPILQYEAFRRVDPLAGPGSVVEARGGALDPGGRVALARRAGMISEEGLLLAGWDFVGAVPAHGESEYGMIVPTLADSTANGVPWSVYFIRAATASPTTYFDSAPDSGYSIDNLAPNIPQEFVVTEMVMPGHDLVLEWQASHDADFRYYSLHRSSVPGFVPSLANLVTDLTANTYVDPGAGITLPLYYKLAATDFAGNRSVFAEASTFGAVDVAAADGPTHLALHPAAPNPTRAGSTVRFDLPSPSRVRLGVFDVNGRLLRKLVDGEWIGAGRHQREWDGRDGRGANASAGIYFVRLEAGSLARTTQITVMPRSR